MHGCSGHAGVRYCHKQALKDCQGIDKHTREQSQAHTQQQAAPPISCCLVLMTTIHCGSWCRLCVGGQWKKEARSPQQQPPHQSRLDPGTIPPRAHTQTAAAAAQWWRPPALQRLAWRWRRLWAGWLCSCQ